MAIDWTVWPSDPSWSSSWDFSKPPWIRPARPTTIRWQLQRATTNASLPVSLALAKQHLRVDDDNDDDELIEHLIHVATEYVEVRAGIALMPSSWKLWLDRFPAMDRVEYWPWASQVLGAILLPRPPVRAVTSIAWHDSSLASHVVAPTDYVVDLVHSVPRVVPGFGKSWPSSTPLVPVDGVEVAFDAGYSSYTTVPYVAKQAILLLVGHWYINREEVIVDLRVVAHQIPVAAADLIELINPGVVVG
jgi:uncharacterized phiE125 gp8 family phage protein